jgi:2-keto-3-deoxy-galactonokinase
MVNKQVISFYNLDFTWIFKDLKQLAKSTLVQKDKVSICGTSGSREGWTEKSK